MHTKTDSIQSSAEALRYPWENHPGHDQVVEVMPGVLWARLKLPFRLNHVNIYLLADGDGWTMVDSGFGNEESIAAWTTLFEGPLKGIKVSRLIVTHSHPDHVGLAGWITERFHCPLYMSQVEYLQSVYHQNRGTEERRNAQRLFFLRHGMDENLTDKLWGGETCFVNSIPPALIESVSPAKGPVVQAVVTATAVAIEATAKSIVDAGGDAIAVRFDLADESSIAALMQAAVDTYGGLDLLHCNGAALALMIQDSNPVDVDVELWDKTFHVDLRGYMHWTLLDNYEWAEGFTQKFGLATRERVLRPSARLYGEIARTNSLSSVDAANFSVT